MSSIRQEKYSKLLQKTLGDYFRMAAPSFQQGCMISITQVRISPDLAEAKVYLSLFQVSNKEGMLEKIVSRTKEIRRWLGDQIRHQARVTPNLSFFVDDSLDYQENIEKLLNQKPELP